MSLTLTGLVCIASFAAPPLATPAPPAAPPAPSPPVQAGPPTPPDTAQARRAPGETELAAARKAPPDKSHARNLILFIGDGMGLSTVTAARIRQGQSNGAPGEENRLSFEVFPATALAKTYNSDQQAASAAGAVTAIVSGVKTRGAAVGVDQVPEPGQCKEAAGHETQNLFEQAKAAGRAVGLVTTSRVTLGPPAATYAHVSNQDWEVDSRMPDQARDEGCRDIARQLVEFNSGGGLDVVLGGGRLAFLTPEDADPIQPQRFGVRGDGVNLITEWSYRFPTGRYFYTAAQLAAADQAWRAAPSSASSGKSGQAQDGPVLGLFAPDDMAFQDTKPDDQPSLTQRTVAAIDRLRRAPTGFVLVVDAGNIDTAHHQGEAALALDETVELSNAVAAAETQLGAERDDTLIVVTADHGHTPTIFGYPRRGAPMTAQTRSGEDAPVYATGPGAQGVHGVIEQTTLYFIMAQALGLAGTDAGAARPPS
jgi:alkaline phosphatase